MLDTTNIDTSINNETSAEDDSIRDPVTMLSILVVGTFLSLLIFLSIAGNILVCVAIYTDRGLRRIGNLFLASLAIADLFVASLVMTFAGVNDLLGYWVFGAQFCDTWIAFDVMCSTASILNLCAISLDRYIHIKDPLRYGRWVTRRVAVATIAAIWLLAALISFVPISLGLHRPPQPLIYHDEHGKHYPTCALDLTPSYAVISSCISFYVPCIVMIGIYCRLYCYAQKHVKSIRAVTRPIEIPTSDNTNPNVSTDSNLNQQEQQSTSTSTSDKKRSVNLRKTLSRKTAKQSSNSKTHLHIHLHNHQSSPYHVSDHKAAITVGVIMGVFLICWVPFFCINIVAAFCKTCIPDITFKILTWLGYSNSAFNPIIYSIFNTEFREAFKRILTTHYTSSSSNWCHVCGYHSVRRSSSIDIINKKHHHHHHHGHSYVTDYGTKTVIVSTSLRRNKKRGSLGGSFYDFNSTTSGNNIIEKCSPRSSVDSIRYQSTATRLNSTGTEFNVNSTTTTTTCGNNFNSTQPITVPCTGPSVSITPAGSGVNEIGGNGSSSTSSHNSNSCSAEQVSAI